MRVKGGEFLIKQVEKIFTPEDFTEEQKMMRDSVTEFVDREIWPKKERFEKKDYDLTEEIMRKIGELGFLGVSISEKYGGLEMGFTSTALVCDYISGATGSIATAFGAHTGIGTLPIAYYGTDEQKQKYLPKIVSGEHFCSYCLTEPEAGSDANSGKTKAVLSGDGTHYEITGQKMWISNAGFANILIVFARIEDDKNITGFIVENEASNGISMGEEEHKLGIRSSSTRQVFFNNTKVPVGNMLGERGEGFKIALNVLNVGRIKLGAACLEAQRRVISNSVKYANERVQFKTPIANFEAIQYKISEMATKAFASESGVYRAAYDIEKATEEHIAAGDSHEMAEKKAFEEFAVECALIKVYGSEAMQYVSDEGIQILGGMGFSEDTMMEAAWRDARITRIYEGTNEINRLLSVGMLIKKGLKGELDLMTPATEVGKELMGIPSFEIPDYSEILSEEKDMIAKLRKVILMIAGKAVQDFMMELEKQQFLLTDAANALIEIYMAESAILRAIQTAKAQGEEAAKVQIALAQLNLYNAIDIINKSGKNALYSFVEGDEQRGMLMGLKRFTKYINMPNPYELRRTIAKAFIDENGYAV
ncbi:MAG: acyl-CoA dehydrogenase family protein [Flavobacteriales bacterium]